MFYWHKNQEEIIVKKNRNSRIDPYKGTFMFQYGKETLSTNNTKE
jgi:hypothetical protein